MTTPPKLHPVARARFADPSVRSTLSLSQTTADGHPMTLPDEDFEPDDNYAGGPEGAEIDDEASTEALVWQLLLVINPGDEEAALQQFGAFQEDLDGADAGRSDERTVGNGGVRTWR